MPTPDGGGGIPGLPGWLPPLLRIPVRVPPILVAGYKPRNPNESNKDPIAPPVPPDPRFPALNSTEQGNFSTWLNGLREGDYAGGNPQDNAYQRRVAGYPEREVHIPPGSWDKNTLMVDGFRKTDGMAVEAKHVRDPKNCFRTLDSLQSDPPKKPRFLYDDDREEMAKYSAAMKDPRNTEMRGVEVDTDYRDSVPYWRVMMATYGVKGYARYAP
ncbi:hypothetical protein KDA82_35870 [Streptomyces daliensis]|uniref:Tox-REase-2 domain-containing protein n=1 Tax=Streptomyces daliensis TaxID=299421 RepID=A0A8T4J4S3_9ACTN|nr:hypothetical protein [Streptomyces daliensis]